MRGLMIVLLISAIGIAGAQAQTRTVAAPAHSVTPPHLATSSPLAKIPDSAKTSSGALRAAASAQGACLLSSSSPFPIPITSTPVTIKGVFLFNNNGGCIVADLANLQKQITSVVNVKTLNLPTNNCAHYKLDNPVVALSGTSLVYANGDAALNLAGTVTIWTCLQNPIPNSKLTWVLKHYWWGSTNVPIIVTWPGDPIKTIIGTQPFTAQLLLSPVVVNTTTVGLQLDSASVNLQGQYVSITNGVLNICGINVNMAVYNILKKVISTTTFTPPKSITVQGVGLSNSNSNFPGDSLFILAWGT